MAGESRRSSWASKARGFGNSRRCKPSGAGLLREDPGRAEREPEDDGLLFLAQQARLIAGRQYLLENGRLGQGTDGALVRDGGVRIRGGHVFLPPLRHERGEIPGVRVPRSMYRWFFGHPGSPPVLPTTKPKAYLRPVFAHERVQWTLVDTPRFPHPENRTNIIDTPESPTPLRMRATVPRPRSTNARERTP